MITDFKTCSIRNFEILICTYFLQLFLVLQLLKYKDKFTYVLKESMPYVFDLLVFENKFAYSLVYKKRHFGGTLFVVVFCTYFPDIVSFDMILITNCGEILNYH